MRGVRVMLDEDLAFLYRVETKYLVRQFKRNLERFPEGYAFQITKGEFLRCQNGTSKQARGGRRYLPYAFTEHGTLLLSSILRSATAIKVNQTIIQVFVELRQQVMTRSEYEQLKQSVRHIESRMDALETHAVVDNTMLTTKMTELSREVQEMRKGHSQFLEAIDQFESAHIIIQRPDNDPMVG